MGCKEKLKPKVLRRFAPQAELYLAYARAWMRMPGPEETFETRQENFRSAAETLRELAGPGRGLPPGFYRTIAAEYQAFVEGDEEHPVKALSEKHHVTISAASRWVKGARDRGYLPSSRPGKVSA